MTTMITYESSVDKPGDESGVVYVSSFRAVAKSQLLEKTRLDKGNITLGGSGVLGLVLYDSSVDTIGEDFGFTYVSRFWEVATSQLPKIGRSWKAKRANGSGSAGLGVT